MRLNSLICSGGLGVHGALSPYPPNESIRINVTVMKVRGIKHDLSLVVKCFQTSPIHHSHSPEAGAPCVCEMLRERVRLPAHRPGLLSQGAAGDGIEAQADRAYETHWR